MTAFEPHPITGQPIGLPVERIGAAPGTGHVEGPLRSFGKTAARPLV